MEINKALLEVAKAVADEAKTSLEGLVWHADETAGHAHTAWCGYDFEGNPLSTTMKRGMLMRFQDRMAAIMNERAPGIERGRSKLDRLNAGANFAETVHLSVKQLHAKLPADIAAKEAELAELQNNIQGLIDREAEMQGRVDKTLQKLAATSDDEQRLSKRLSDYEKRLAERAAAVAAVEARMEHLNAEIRRHEKDARRAAERVAEREQQLRAIEGAENSSRASLAILEARRADLEAVVLQQTEALEVLKPLYAAARAVEFATTMTAEEEQAAWTEMMFTGQCDDALEHATAIRMCDPFFMPNVDRSRHPAPSDNLIYLHALKSDNPDAYRHLIESVSAEPNAGEAVEYLQAGALRVQNGKIRLLGLADKGPGVFERAIGWLRQAFEGVKRGFGIQRAQELGKALDPATIAEAGLFASFNEKQRAALLYAVQTKANPGRDVSAADRLETDLEISPGFR